jgi:CRP-like cAMP-binding protein
MTRTKLISGPKTAGNKASCGGTRKGTSSRLYRLIERQPLFEGLSAAQLEMLAGLAMEMEFEPGEYIFRQQDPANRFYVILEGRVEVELASPPDGIKPIQIAGPGDHLGWSWLFEPYSFYVSARITEPTRTIFIYGTMLRQYCEEDHDLGYEIVKRVAGVALKRLIAFQQNIQERT